MHALGTLHRIESGFYTATIAEVGAALYDLTADGVDLVQPFSAEGASPLAAGQVLVPWPNRIADGRWILDGQPQQLAVTEPSRNNAVHGLLCFSPYAVRERTASSITLAATVFPQYGYPFRLETSVRYGLTAEGLAVTHRVRNVSQREAPVAIGAHPYITIGDVPVDQLRLTVLANRRVVTDARLIPTGEAEVAGSRFDLRAGVGLAELHVEDGFFDLQRQDGVVAWLEAGDGRRLSLWQDESMPYLQAFVTREFPAADGVTVALALEPMTAPANAFNTGQSLSWLAPDAELRAGWGLRFERPASSADSR